MEENTNKTVNNDIFAKLASGGKKMTGEVKRLQEISPLLVKKKYLSPSKEVVVLPRKQTEQEKYNNFLEEKEKLKAKYTPYLKNYARKISDSFVYIVDFSYRKETQEDKQDFLSVLDGKGKWEHVKVPHYNGPDGEWNCFYRTKFQLSIQSDRQYLLYFQAVDYIAEVYINGRMVKTHEGFFAPFDVNITPYVRSGDNTLLVVCKNLNTTTSVNVDNMACYGDKIYGATNIGYDEPTLGWHHCPAGAGILGRVKLYTIMDAKIQDIFVQTDTENGKIKVQTTVNNYSHKPKTYRVFYTIEGRNFQEVVCEDVEGKCDRFQTDTNYLCEEFNIPDFKMWDIDTPYLYEVTVTLKDERGCVVDSAQNHFGMRSFVSDEKSIPKGKFYLNGRRIMLRGTNEMGHLSRAVMEGKYETLVDDILTAKIANLNYYRMTQRPVFEEIYSYFDALGMLCQSDFPLFSYLKPSALGEALKQVDEMERLTRSHPSVIIESLCNETLDKTAWGKEQYVLSRFEIEKFFDSAKKIIEIDNPQRVVKYSEGDYSPLENGYGLNDFHLYTYWYISHGLPSGKMRKGYLPPIRKDWMCGCGEFGVDGLDRIDLLKKYCPIKWIEDDNGKWSPVNIAKAQCYSLHGDFFQEQSTMEDWVEESRKWQEYAIREYVNLLRLRSDYIQSTAVHLLIDAWPCGWTKALVDVDRIPKPAYYSLKEANTLVRPYIRRDRFTLYTNEETEMELYIFNDLPVSKNKKLIVTVTYPNGQSYSYERIQNAKAVGTTYVGSVKIISSLAGKIQISCQMDNEFDSVEMEVYDRPQKVLKPDILVSDLTNIYNLCTDEKSENIRIVDDEYYAENKKVIEDFICNGGKVVCYMQNPLKVFDEDIIFKTHTLEEEVRANNLIFASNISPYTKDFKEKFENIYNFKKGYQDLTAWFKFYWNGADEILYTLEDTKESGFELHKRHKFIMAEKKYEKGKLILTTLSCIKECIGDPVLDKFLITFLNNLYRE